MSFDYELARSRMDDRLAEAAAYRRAAVARAGRHEGEGTPPRRLLRRHGRPRPRLHRPRWAHVR